MVQKVKNMPSTNTICACVPKSMKNERNSNSANQICSNQPHNVCVHAESKLRQLKQHCSCNEKEHKAPIGRVGVKNRIKMQVTSKRKDLSTSKCLTMKEYKELEKNDCSKKNQNADLEMDEEEKQRLIKESMERREEFRQIDMQRPREKDAELLEIEEEATKRARHMLERAENMKLEQEEEIKKCNRIILESKCRAIRDAQIAEKKLIEEELSGEEKRLNDIMENERRWAIREELKKDQEAISKRQEFANSLKDQIMEIEEQRMLDFERKQEESRLINLSNIAWQQAEIAKVRNKEAEHARIRREFAGGNEQLKHFQAMQEQENKIIDLRIQEYQRQKQEREAKLKEEQRLEQIKKEQNKDKIAMQTMHVQDLQARIDELNAIRIQEEVDREWRRKEKEEALKRLETQKSIMEEREKQINSKRLMQAIELERERREFEKIVIIQKEAFCREQKELETKQKQALIHRSEILKQVNEKERQRIETRRKIFEEGLAIRTEAEMRKKRLRDAMERKCKQMETNNVPEMYINDVKRMIENIQ